MMLGRRAILQAWRTKRLRFSPNIRKDQIDLSSVDLRLGFRFTRLKAQRAVVIRPAHDFDPTDLTETEDLSGSKDPLFRIRPGEFVLAQTLETISLPNNLSAHVHGKSSLARTGLTVHATAPHIHPGWEGKITLEFYNCGPLELEFVPGQDMICQVIFWELRLPPSKKVIQALSSYSGQDSPFPRRKGKQKNT